MNILKTAALAATGMLLLAACQPAGQDPAKEMDAIRAVNGAWAGHYNDGDADGVANLYWDNALLMPPGVPAAEGRAAIRDAIAQDISASKAASLTMNIDHGPIGVSGNLAYQTGNWKVTDATGATVDVGKYLSVLEKRDGKWLLLRDTWNSDMPPAPAPAAEPPAE